MIRSVQRSNVKWFLFVWFTIVWCYSTSTNTTTKKITRWEKIIRIYKILRLYSLLDVTTCSEFLLLFYSKWKKNWISFAVVVVVVIDIIIAFGVYVFISSFFSFLLLLLLLVVWSPSLRSFVRCRLFSRTN